MWSLPEFGTSVIYAVLVAAAYTFAVALAAGRGHPRLLTSARLGAYATCALVLLGVLMLTYAFVSHDFRIRYVSHYSDRSMPTIYLITSLWGGQDGSLLWWSFLLACYTAICLTWLKGRYRQLQPYVIATLMVIISFFAVLMLFAANPFEASIAGARPDGEGLNPLLQNYWMIIHPPALYTGFVGCSIPFAFCVAALVTGRLDNEWIVAVRKWMLFAFLFLSIGNGLGMAWAYEELGWGGFWAWDPVENAACLPWFTASAYVHSTMIQERRNILKVWNVFLICFTFLLTIFGTFLTRAGIITSVHSFAQSDIGRYFLWFIGLAGAASLALGVWRAKELRANAEIESVASREAMFVVNNWALLGGMTFILASTMYPKLSELWGENTTVGPSFFNRWMGPIGLVIFLLMGLAPLFGWRKTSNEALKRALYAPVGAFIGMTLLHIVFGKSLGYPAFVEKDPLFAGAIGSLFQKIASAAPVLTIGLAAFNVAVIVQEFYRGAAARMRTAGQRNAKESVAVALYRLVDKNRRRYGGYIVHLGICGMFVGFVGTAWNIDQETSLLPNQTTRVGRYEMTYLGSRMCPGNPRCSPEEQADLTKRMVFADLQLKRDGKDLGILSPAKFIFHKSPEGPTTEVAMRRSLREDVYTIVGTVDPQSKRATFKFHINPFVTWIWLGISVLVVGAAISLWPDVSLGSSRAWAFARAGGSVAAGTMLSIWLAMTPGSAYARERPDKARPVLRVESPLPRLVHSGAIWAPVLGLGLGLASAGSLSRRKRNSSLEAPTPPQS
ncbi:MAG TPA: cytochrome c-type biogenesis CcmF C-terminal domain-containing protein [Polyangiaceae bacterium]|nr:cytochrome c-type biogenesis CcmF C-terminal domain-containing protein [Polyangiaceae bacterium]